MVRFWSVNGSFLDPPYIVNSSFLDRSCIVRSTFGIMLKMQIFKIKNYSYTVPKRKCRQKPNKKRIRNESTEFFSQLIVNKFGKEINIITAARNRLMKKKNSPDFGPVVSEVSSFLGSHASM